MTERGLPIVDGAPACPFVAFEDDRDARSTSPDHRHRCYAEDRPAPRAIAHQEAYCLSSQFPVCPTFQDWARREAAEARSTATVPEGRGGESAPPRDWTARPPWSAAAAGSAGVAAGAGAQGAGIEAMAGEDDEDAEGPPDRGMEWTRSRGAEAPGSVASRSAAVEGAGLAGSAADRLAGPRGAAALDEDADAESWDDRSDGYDDEAETRARRRSPRASGGIGFGRDRRPRVGATRRAEGWEEVGPSWERPRHHDAYPTLRTRMGFPRLSRVGIAAIALVLAAIGLFFLPQLLGVGSRDGTGGRPGESPPAAGASASAEATPIAEPTPLIYLVRSGDTMSRIAQQFGVSLDDLIAANRQNIPDPDALQIGDQVIIPTPAPDGSAGSPEPSPSA